MKAREYFESRNVIKANSLLSTLRSVRLMGLFGTACMASLLLFSALIDVLFNGGRHFANGSHLYTYILLIVWFIPLVVNSVLRERYWKRIELRRFAAVRGNQLFLAAEQPLPDSTSMPLPTIIRFHQSKKPLLLTTTMLILIAFFLAALFAWFNNNPLILSPNPLLNLFALFSLAALLPLGIIAAFYFSSLTKEQIIVTESGLSAHVGRQALTVMWQEARLFAMYGTFGAQKSGAAITYELSSARDIVRWTWILRKTYWVGLEPVIPHDEYNRQMQALLSFVTARTGLPLYDLREDLPRGGPKD